MGLTSLTSKQREISTNLSFEEQIDNLKSLIKNSPQNSRVCEFGPELAEYILSNLNVNNRPRKVKKIIQYRRDMQNRNWSLTGETIKFGTDGFLKDGQNRLAACIQAQTPFTTHAIFGIDPATFHHMDTGKNRGADDVLAIMGVKNHAKIAMGIKYITAYEAGNPSLKNTLSNQAVKDAYLNRMNTQLLQDSLAYARRVNRMAVNIPVGPLMAVHYLASSRGKREVVERFYEILMTGNGTAKSPARFLLTTINKLVSERQAITTEQYSIMLGRSWYNFKNGKSSTKADMHVTKDDRMMEI